MKPIFIAVAAITLDGKIAERIGHFSNWTSKEDKDFLHSLYKKTDVVVVGNTTFALAKKPLAKVNCVVFTKKVKGIKVVSPTLTYLNPGAVPLKKFLAERGYARVCVLGGSVVYTYALRHNLLDELYLTIEPISFGAGIPLFAERMRAWWKLKSVKKLNKRGSLLLHYTRDTP